VISVLFFNNATEGQQFLQFIRELPGALHLSVCAIVGLIILFGTLSKSYQLRAGGQVVAEMMGARLVPGNTADLSRRQLLNIVEEMAIASGIPVPPVYIQEQERSINAFAAGRGTDDAIICVTQGTLEALDRDALQGVIAHEFSHILNGDMRMNIIITSILNGILLLGLMGARMMRHLSIRRSSSRNSGGVVFIGLGLMAIGFGGSLFGSLIKATVNRQREYLADASAVQFTRNPAGIGSALKAIGGYSYGSRLLHPNGAEISHFLFASGHSVWLQSLFSTHPPLSERILRLDPDWDGSYPQVSTSFTKKVITEEILDGKQQQRFERAAPVTAIVVADAIARLEQSGEANLQHLDDARTLIASLPVVIKNAAHDPYHARALVYALLLSADKNERSAQQQIIAEQAEAGVDEKLKSLYIILRSLGRETYLPLLEMALPALRSCSQKQIAGFLRVVNRLVRHDNHVSLFEWCLTAVIRNNLTVVLDKASNRPGYLQLARVNIQVRVILSLLARSGSSDEAMQKKAYNAALDFLEIESQAMYADTDLRFETVDHALKQIDRLVPLDKQRFLNACIVLIKADHTFQIEEIEVVRAVASALHCPIPSLPLAVADAV